MHSDAPSLMIKRQRKRSLSTLQISKRSIGEKSRFDSHILPKAHEASSGEKSLTSIVCNAQHLQRLVSCCVINHLINRLSYKSRRTRKNPDYFGFDSSVSSVSDNDSVPVPKRHKLPNPVIETLIKEEAPQTPVADISFELPLISPPTPPPTGTWSLEEYEFKDFARKISMSGFDAKTKFENCKKLIIQN